MPTLVRVDRFQKEASPQTCRRGSFVRSPCPRARQLRRRALRRPTVGRPRSRGAQGRGAGLGRPDAPLGRHAQRREPVVAEHRTQQGLGGRRSAPRRGTRCHPSPVALRRRGPRELPSRDDPEVGPRLRDAGEGPPRPDHGARLGLRSDRPPGERAGFWEHRRGDGRPQIRHRKRRHAAYSLRHQHRRLVGVSVRRDRHPPGASRTFGQRAGAGGRRGHLRGRRRPDGVDDGRLRGGRRAQIPERPGAPRRGAVERVPDGVGRGRGDRRQRRFGVRPPLRGDGQAGAGRRPTVPGARCPWCQHGERSTS